MAFPFFFSYGAFFYLAANEHLSWALYFTSRPTRIPFDTFFYLAADEGLLFSGAFFYLAANEGSLVIERDAIGLNGRPMSRRFSGAFFYLAANEDLLSRALSFTSRPTRISFQWRFLLTRGQRVSRALSFTSRPTRIFSLITDFSSIWSLSSLYYTRSILCMCRSLSSCNMRKVSF